MRMTWQFGEALDGNIAVMGEIEIEKNPEFTIAISFGDGHHAALAGMMQSLATPFEQSSAAVSSAVGESEIVRTGWRMARRMGDGWRGSARMFC